MSGRYKKDLYYYYLYTDFYHLFQSTDKKWFMDKITDLFLLGINFFLYF